MTANAADGYGRQVARLTPDAVRRTGFPRTPLGRRGYAEEDVDRFRARVAEEISRADAEKAELRAEIDRLRNYFRERRIAPELADDGRENGHRDDAAPPAQVVNMMSMAQQAADQHIAEAEAYARALLGDARRQYEEIVTGAHQRAAVAAEEAAEAYRTSTAPAQQSAEQAELEARIAYLRTFADVTQVQMRSILDALGQQLDRLADFGSPAAALQTRSP